MLFHHYVSAVLQKKTSACYRKKPDCLPGTNHLMPALLPVFLPVWRSLVNCFMLSNPVENIIFSMGLSDFPGYAFGTAMLSYRSRNLTIQKQVPHLIISNRPLPLIFQKLCWICRYGKVYYIRACFSIKKSSYKFYSCSDCRQSAPRNHVSRSLFLSL